MRKIRKQIANSEQFSDTFSRISPVINGGRSAVISREFLTMRIYNDQEQAIRYFLGELSKAERTAVEKRFFADADYSRFLDAAENDLIDDYVGGKLDFQRKQNFERRFLISERRREAVRSAKILQTNRFAAKNEAVGFVARQEIFWKRLENLFCIPKLAWASGLVATVLILFVGLQVTIRLPENGQIAAVNNENQKSAAAALTFPVSPSKENLPPAAEKAGEQNDKNLIAAKSAKKAFGQTPEQTPILEKRSAAKSGNTKTMITTLAPQQSGEERLIVSQRDAEKIRLRIAHRNERNFVKYLVEIRAADGDLVWSREIDVSEKTLRKPLSFYVRSGALNAGFYGLTLSGATADRQLEEINSYNFSVQKK